MANKSVTITVTGGAFTYSALNKAVMRGDFLEWTCNKDFAIQFKGRSPLKNASNAGASANSSTGLYEIKKNPGGKRKLKHPYIVAAYDGGTIYIDDPQIIVEDQGPGGGVRKKAAKKRTAKKRATKK